MHATVTATRLLSEGVPASGVEVVVVIGDTVDPFVSPETLSAVQGATRGRVVVAGAPPDLDQGTQGALAGLGVGWAAHRDDLHRALILEPAPVTEAEVRWRLWNAGVDVVRAPGAGTTTHRAEGGSLLADRIPLPALRSWSLTEATVPTVTVIVHGEDPDPAVVEPWPERSRVPSEVLLVGSPGPREGRIRAVPDLATAVDEARGALLWFVHARAVADREAWARALRRFEDERIVWVQVAYDLPSGTSRSSRGLLLADRALGAPAFALVRRRDIVRRRPRPLLDAWADVLGGERGTSILSHPVPVDVEVPRRPVPTLSALVAGATELARDVVRDARAGSVSAAVDPARPSVGWVGFSGKGNFGDELVLEAGRSLLPGVDLVPAGEGTHGTVLGGGTLLNADRYYQRMADEIDAPGLRRLVLGTGVVSPAVKGWTEDLAGWSAFLHAGPVGVRGPNSAEHLRSWAAAELPDWRGTVEVLGDPALALTPTAEQVDGLVVLAPIGASAVGQVDAEDERRQVELLVDVARAARADDRPVRLLTAHAGDDRVALAVLRALDDDVDDVVVAHRDIEAGCAALAAADVVVGARLHALVAAAAAGTTFLGLAYRPKIVDFAASVGMEDRVAPIGSWSSESLVAAVRAGVDQNRHDSMVGAVDGYRSALRERAAGFLDDL